MSDEMAQALIAELVAIKLELGALRKVEARSGWLIGAPQAMMMILFIIAIIAWIIFLRITPFLPTQ